MCRALSDCVWSCLESNSSGADAGTAARVLLTLGGFVTAGLAIAAQRVFTNFTGDLVLMRGNTFTVGDRIKMGGVHWRLTDNWLELTVRFLVPEHGIRDIKSALARRVLNAFDDAGLQLASATIDITAFPS